MSQCRWAIFVSGQGTNMVALLEARPEDVAVVFSSRAQAPAVQKAKDAGKEVVVLPPDIDWKEVLKSLEEKQITHIFLLGFLKVLPGDFLKNWKKPIFNLHPSLLPAYPGLKSIERAREDEASIGVTVHRVVEAVDAGEILYQENVYGPGEALKISLQEVREKVRQVEHELVIKTVKEITC